MELSDGSGHPCRTASAVTYLWARRVCTRALSPGSAARWYRDQPSPAGALAHRCAQVAGVRLTDPLALSQGGNTVSEVTFDYLEETMSTEGEQ